MGDKAVHKRVRKALGGSSRHITILFETHKIPAHICMFTQAKTKLLMTIITSQSPQDNRDRIN